MDTVPRKKEKKNTARCFFNNNNNNNNTYYNRKLYTFTRYLQNKVQLHHQSV